MATSVELGQGDSPDELEDGELPDSDDEAEVGAKDVEASKPFSQGPALGSKRPFETIWGGQNSASKRSKDESGEEDGEIISDDEEEEEDFNYHANDMAAENASSQSFDNARYSYPMEPHMFDTHFMQQAHNSTTHPAKSAHPVANRNQSGRHGNSAGGSASPSGRNHTSRSQPQSSKREHKSRGGGSKHTALPHPTDPFWGTFKTLLPTPNVPPITGVDLELDYPPLPDELAKEYGLDYIQVFVRDEPNGKQQQQQQQRPQQQRQQKQHHPQHQTKPVDAVKQVQCGGDSTFPNSIPTSVAFSAPHSGMETANISAPSSEYPNHHQGVSGTANPSLVDPLNEAFPLIDQGEESEPSLQDLVLGTDHDKAEEAKKESLKKAVSLKKKLKGVEWHRRQSERDKQAKVVKAAQPCKFYIHGSCRAGEECPYSHDVAKEKRREICKYFMTDSCTKGDDCTYYHGPIPCKYHHSSTGCYRGNQCRFSHEPLTEVTSEILQQLLALKAEKRKQQQQSTGPQPAGGGVGGGFPPVGPPDHGMPRAPKQGLLPTPSQPPLSQVGILGDTPLPPFHHQVPAQTMVPIPYAEATHEAEPFSLQEEPSQPFATITDPRTMRGKQSDYPPQYSNDNVQSLLRQQQAPPPSAEPPPLFLTNPPPLFPQHAQPTQTDPRATSHVAATHRVTQPAKQPVYQDGHPVASSAVAREATTQSSTTVEHQSKAAKYAHLKVKSRQGQSAGAMATAGRQATEEVSSPAVGATEQRTKSAPFQMPESLYDPSILSKPLDPRSLFGSASEDDGSLPFSSRSSGGDSQIYGQINMASPSQQISGSDPAPDTSSTLAVKEGDSSSGSGIGGSKSDGEKKGDDTTALPYYAMFDTGLGGDDLEIDSAFGELA